MFNDKVVIMFWRIVISTSLRTYNW